MFVSILVINWNGRKWLEDCLSSILAQRADNITFEVILIDNGSTDNSVEFVRSRFQEVKIVELGANYGFAEGNNRGIEYATGEYLIFVNMDVKALDEWLKNLVGAADQNADYEILVSLELPEGEKNYVRTINAMGDAVLGLKCFQDITDSLFACGGCFLIRRKWLTKLGYLFDPHYFCYAEDLELSLRTIFLGGKIGYVRDSKIYHRGGSSKLYRPTIYYYDTRNILFTYYKVLKIQKFVRICSVNISYKVLRSMIEKQPLNLYAVLKAIGAFVLEHSRYSSYRNKFSRIKSRDDNYVFERLYYRSDVERKLFSRIYAIS